MFGTVSYYLVFVDWSFFDFSLELFNVLQVDSSSGFLVESVFGLEFWDLFFDLLGFVGVLGGSLQSGKGGLLFNQKVSFSLLMGLSHFSKSLVVSVSQFLQILMVLGRDGSSFGLLLFSSGNVLLLVLGLVFLVLGPVLSGEFVQLGVDLGSLFSVGSVPLGSPDSHVLVSDGTGLSVESVDGFVVESSLGVVLLS